MIGATKSYVPEHSDTAPGSRGFNTRVMNAHAQANSESFLDSAVDFVRPDFMQRVEESQAAHVASLIIDKNQSFQLSIDAGGAPAPFPMTLGDQSPSSPDQPRAAHLQVEVKAAAAVTFMQKPQFVETQNTQTLSKAPLEPSGPTKERKAVKISEPHFTLITSQRNLSMVPSSKTTLPTIQHHRRPTVDGHFEWFKKDRKIHRDEDIFHLNPMPAKHADLHPKNQPLQLFYEKVKKQTLLAEFDHQIIEKRSRSLQRNNYRTLDPNTYVRPDKKPRPPANQTKQRQRFMGGLHLPEISPNRNGSQERIQHDDEMILERAVVPVAEISSTKKKQIERSPSLRRDASSTSFLGRLATFGGRRLTLDTEGAVDVDNSKIFGLKSPLSMKKMTKEFAVQNSNIMKSPGSHFIGEPSSEQGQIWDYLKNQPLTTFSHRRNSMRPSESTMFGRFHINTSRMVPGADATGISMPQEILEVSEKNKSSQGFLNSQRSVPSTIKKQANSHLRAYAQQNLDLHSPMEKYLNENELIDLLQPGISRKQLQQHTIAVSGMQRNKSIVVPMKKFDLRDESDPNDENSRRDAVVSILTHSRSPSQFDYPQIQPAPSSGLLKYHMSNQMLSEDEMLRRTVQPQKPAGPLEKRQLTKEQKFVMNQPLTGYLSNQVHSNYFERVRKIQKENSERHVGGLLKDAKVGMSPLASRSDVIDKIMERTVGEAGSLSQETTDKEATLEDASASEPIKIREQSARHVKIPIIARDNTSPSTSTVAHNVAALASKLSPRSGPSPKRVQPASNRKVDLKKNSSKQKVEVLEATKLVRPGSPEELFYQHKVKGKIITTPAAIEITRMELVERDGSKEMVKVKHRTVDEDERAGTTGSGSAGAEVASRVSRIQSQISLIQDKHSPHPDSYKPVKLQNVADTMQPSPVLLDHSPRDPELSNTQGDSFKHQRNLTLESGPSPLLLPAGQGYTRDSRHPDDNHQSGSQEAQQMISTQHLSSAAVVSRVIEVNPFAQQSPPLIERKLSASNLTNNTGATQKVYLRSPEDDRLQYATPSPEEMRSKQSSPRQNTPVNKKDSKYNPTQTMLPNGSIVHCSVAVKQLIESIPPKVRIKQFLRLAHQELALEVPYVKIALPDESILLHLKDLNRFRKSKEPLCLVLLKSGQMFERATSELCEIALDSLQRQFYKNKEDELQQELKEQQRIIQKINLLEQQLQEHQASSDFIQSVRQEIRNSEKTLETVPAVHGNKSLAGLPLADSMANLMLPGRVADVVTPILKNHRLVSGTRADDAGGILRQNASQRELGTWQMHSAAEDVDSNLKPDTQLETIRIAKSDGNPEETTNVEKFAHDSRAASIMDALRNDNTLQFIQNIDLSSNDDKRNSDAEHQLEDAHIRLVDHARESNRDEAPESSLLRSPPQLGTLSHSPPIDVELAQKQPRVEVGGVIIQGRNGSQDSTGSQGQLNAIKIVVDAQSKPWKASSLKPRERLPQLQEQLARLKKKSIEEYQRAMPMQRGLQRKNGQLFHALVYLQQNSGLLLDQMRKLSESQLKKMPTVPGVVHSKPVVQVKRSPDRITVGGSKSLLETASVVVTSMGDKTKTATFNHLESNDAASAAMLKDSVGFLRHTSENIDAATNLDIVQLRNAATFGNLRTAAVEVAASPMTQTGVDNMHHQSTMESHPALSPKMSHQHMLRSGRVNTLERHSPGSTFPVAANFQPSPLTNASMTKIISPIQQQVQVVVTADQPSGVATVAAISPNGEHEVIPTDQSSPSFFEASIDHRGSHVPRFVINDLGIGVPELGRPQKIDDRSDSLEELRDNHLGGVHKQVQAKEESLSFDDPRLGNLPRGIHAQMKYN